jgi:two-component system, NarL family, sensor kinase
VRDRHGAGVARDPSGTRRRRATWLILWLALGACALSLALRVGLPSDGARVAFYAGAWSEAGVLIDPIDAPAAGLRAGDRITSVDGRSLEAWATALLDPATVRPDTGAPYDRERAGVSESLDIGWTQPTIGATLLEGWSVALVSIVAAVLAAWVYRRRPDTPAATALMLVAAGIAGSSVPWFLGVTVSDLVRGGPFLLQAVVTGPLYMLIWPAGLHLALAFPTPSTAIVRRRWLVPGLYAVVLGAYLALTLGLAATTTSTLEWIGLWPLAQVAIIVPTMVVTVAIVVARHLRTRDPADRARWRLATIGIAGTASLGLVAFMGPVLLTGRTILPEAAIGLVTLPIPVTLAWAIVHDRLFDIDVAIRRTLVYGGLSLGVVVVYLVAVAGLSAAIGPQEYAVSLMATGVAALAALPLRDGLQRAVVRLLYGQRDQPVDVMRRLGTRLEWATDPAGAFPAVADTLADAFRLPYVALEVADELGRTTIVAERGSARTTVHILPLVHGGEPVGRLVLGLRSGETAFSDGELALLGDLARQAGAAVHAQRLRDDLARSRQRLVATREEERRRLRRDLHDGLGPALAAVAMRAEAASVHLATRPDEARRDLDMIATEARSAVADLRGLVEGLRPPSLDQLGLVGAIVDLAERLGPTEGADRADHAAVGPLVTVEARPEPLPELPAAVEVAAYRIAIEAVTNAVRHADARTCAVRLTAAERLTIEITDDGHGLDGTDWRGGTGLESMRERAAEVGGEVWLAPGQPRGTVVRAELPLRGAALP